MNYNSQKPYNNLPLLPPDIDRIESKEILKQCTLSRVALQELLGEARLIPNQTVLINTIPMLEAKASSEIENIVTTTDKLFRYAQNGTEHNADPATKEALRYRTTLNKGFNSLTDRPLTTSTAINICQAIKGVDMDIRKTPGTALGNDATGGVIYTPPEGERLIRDLLGNWEQFIHNTQDLDPLVIMAIAHYQFEAIHPFTDGNGRTGRIINLLILVQYGLLDLPILYLSRYIIQHKTEYYRLLQNVTLNNDWNSWVMYMLLAVESTAKWTSEKIRSIRMLMDNTIELLRSDLPKIYSRELVEIIFSQPYCRISNLVDEGLGNRHTSSRILRQLVEKNILHEFPVGREKIFINSKMMQTLTKD